MLLQLVQAGLTLNLRGCSVRVLSVDRRFLVSAPVFCVVNVLTLSFLRLPLLDLFCLPLVFLLALLSVGCMSSTLRGQCNRGA